MIMSVIDVENLSKIYKVSLKKPGIKGTINHFFKRNYRDIVAVKDVSFSINSGEIVGFLGANGAGKTTTLKMLTGLIHPSTGEIKIVGHVPFKRHPIFLKKMSLIMGQKQQLLWDLPALDSLKINAVLKGARGHAAIDLERYANIISSISQLICVAPRIVELDLNPLMAGPDGITAVDVRIRLDS